MEEASSTLRERREAEASRKKHHLARLLSALGGDRESEAGAQADDYVELLALLDVYLELVDDAPLEAALDGASKARLLESLHQHGEASEEAVEPNKLAQQHHIVCLENTLTSLARMLSSAGCPLWRVEGHLKAVAFGLGLPETHFGVFPGAAGEAAKRESYNLRCSVTTLRYPCCVALCCRSLCVISGFFLVHFSTLLSPGHGGKTLYVLAAPGLDLRKLDAADEIARRVTSIYSPIYSNTFY